MEKRIIFFVPDEMYEKIETFIKKEYPKFRNISQVVRAALQLYFSKEGQALSESLSKEKSKA